MRRWREKVLETERSKRRRTCRGDDWVRGSERVGRVWSRAGENTHSYVKHSSESFPLVPGRLERELGVFSTSFQVDDGEQVALRVRLSLDGGDDRSTQYADKRHREMIREISSAQKAVRERLRKLMYSQNVLLAR